MQNSELLRHPVIEVSIGGTVVEKRPSRFSLATQAGLHSVMARLMYPAEGRSSVSGAGKAGDDITVSLISGDTRDLYFTGKIYSANTHGKYRYLHVTDRFQNLCDTGFTAAYHKEKAASILDDILGAAGITEKSITCPDVELARFSTPTVTARHGIDLLMSAIKEHGQEGLTYFFDEKDIFHFGTSADTGKNEGEAESFETGKNITSSGPGWIEVLPRPIRHTQDVTVNGKTFVTTRTQLSVTLLETRLVLYLRERT